MADRYQDRLFPPMITMIATMTRRASAKAEAIRWPNWRG